MYRVIQQGEKLRQSQLTTYRASIKATVLLDNGVDVGRQFEIEAELHGSLLQAESLGQRLALELRARGAAEILQSLDGSVSDPSPP